MFLREMGKKIDHEEVSDWYQGFIVIFSGIMMVITESTYYLEMHTEIWE